MLIRRKFMPAIVLAVSASLAVPLGALAANGAPAHSEWPGVTVAEAATEVHITGTVVDPDGDPVDNYHVTARNTAGVALAESLTYGGRYHLWLPEGATVTITGTDGANDDVGDDVAPVWADARLGSVTNATGVVRLGSKRLKFVAPTMVAAPALRGVPIVGKTVEADPGRWTHVRERKIITSVTWLRGTTTIGSGPTYKVKPGDANKQLSFVVSVRSPNSVVAQAAPVVFTAQPVPSAFRITKVKATNKKVTVEVSVTGAKKQTLQLRTKRGNRGKRVAKATGLGTVKLVAPGLKKKQKKVVYFAGNKALGWTKVTAQR